MKFNAAAWVAKAEDHFHWAQYLARQDRKRLGDHICFHGQLSMEAYLKAVLTKARIRFGPNSRLATLMRRVRKVPSLHRVRTPQLMNLNVPAERILYPGQSADRAEVRRVLRGSTRLRKVARAWVRDHG